MSFVANFIRSEQCKKFKNRLRSDEVTESLKVRSFFETQCKTADARITLPHRLIMLRGSAQVSITL